MPTVFLLSRLILIYYIFSEMKDDVAGLMSVPMVFPLSLLRCQESTNSAARSTEPASGTADTLRHVEDRLREKRSSVGRPIDLTNMNSTEMQDEKTALQKALLYYESIHGRPTTREDRDLARPLYDRYRQVKRVVMRTGSVSAQFLLIFNLNTCGRHLALPRCSPTRGWMHTGVSMFPYFYKLFKSILFPL